MSIRLVAIPLLLCATPALAQVAAPAAPAQPEVIQVPPQLADPANVDKLANAMQAMSKAFLDLPVGNVQAALEGRRPTAGDRHRTVRSETGLSERDLNAKIAAAKPQIEQAVKAMNQALPEITRDLEHAQQSIERALSNMPDPTYPRR
jgi:hypothetical protein